MTQVMPTKILNTDILESLTPSFGISLLDRIASVGEDGLWVLPSLLVQYP
jgi:hypothetical protein